MSYSEGKGVGPGLAGVMLRLHFEANSKTMSGIGSACLGSWLVSAGPLDAEKLSPPQSLATQS